MIRTLYLLILIAILAACSNENAAETDHSYPEEKDQAQMLIDQAIKVHGSELVAKSTIDFDFRGRHYRSIRDGGTFQYERIFQDTLGDQYRDVLTNEKLYREKNGQLVELTSKDSSAYANSVNSVLYFALLPYFLNDPAVRKAYEGENQVKGEPYHKIRITFGQEGGGKDFEDQFMYWIHQEKHTIDYLAYNYQTDGGGARFREAINVRNVGGIRFADYINYKPLSESRCP